MKLHIIKSKPESPNARAHGKKHAAQGLIHLIPGQVSKNSAEKSSSGGACCVLLTVKGAKGNEL